jgi:hypothetical protein
MKSKKSVFIIFILLVLSLSIVLPAGFAAKVGSVTVGSQATNPVTAGSSTTFLITVNRGTGSGSPGSFTAELTITGLPDGASGSFSPSSVTFTSADNSKTSTLTVSTPKSLAGATYPFTVAATRTLTTEKATTSANLIVSSFPKFTISASSGYHGSINPTGSVEVYKGDSKVFTVTPDIGYHVDKVLIDNVAASAPYTVSNVVDNSQTIVASFAVDKISTKMSLTCKESSAAPGGKVTLTATLVLDSDHKTPVGDKLVIISYYDPSSPLPDKWIVIASQETNGDGVFQITDWTVPDNLEQGFHALKAVFAGDISGSAPEYLTSNAITSNYGEGLVVLPEYFVGALAALGACFGGFVVIKKRNSLPQLHLK